MDEDLEIYKKYQKGEDFNKALEEKREKEKIERENMEKEKLAEEKKKWKKMDTSTTKKKRQMIKRMT